MLVDFQQGIIKHPTSNGRQTFLQKNGNSVSLITGGSTVEFAISDGTENYHHIEAADVVNAWPGPFDPTKSYWLFIDIDRKTAVRTFGSTSAEPTFGDTKPTAGVEGDHWFNTTDGKMYVFQTGDFRQKIRIFVAELLNNQFFPLSAGIGDQPFAGTQVGLEGTPIKQGRIFVDGNGKPVKRDDGTFFTSETAFFINGSQVNSVRLETTIQHAVTQQPVSVFQICKFSDFGQIVPATYNDMETTVLVMSLDNGVTSDTVEICAQGLINNAAWNWSAVGIPLWVDDTGLLTETDLHEVNPQAHPHAKAPIARVIAKDQILYDQTTALPASTAQATSVSPASISSLGTVRLSVAPLDAGNPIAVETTDPRMSDARQPLTHVHPATSITATPSGQRTGLNVQALLDELEAAKLSVSGGTMSGNLILHSDPVVSLGAATKQYSDVLAKRQPFNNIPGTTYSTTIDDVGVVLRFTSDSAAAVTIPVNADFAAIAGDVLYIRQVGTGQVTLTPASGVVFNTPTGFIAKTGRQGSVISLHYVGSDTWDLTGDFEAVS